MSNNILVIGAVNVDIFAKNDKPYVLEDSNIASISLGFGGVGGNIATNLNTLGENVSFLTVFSNDILGKFVMSHYKERNIDISEALISTTNNQSVYLGIMDQENDLFLGLNDMNIVKELSMSYLKSKHNYINQFEYIVIDTNFDKDILEYFYKRYQHKHLITDAVSAEKVSKLLDFLPYISTLKCNKIELNALSNHTEIENQIQDVLSKGVKELLITDKSNPVMYADKELLTEFPVKLVKDVVNATGAGDAFISGYISGLLHNIPLQERIHRGTELARKTLKSKTSTIEKSDL